jgi:hypothetical protein
MNFADLTLGKGSALERLEKVSAERYDFAESERERRAQNFAERRVCSSLVIPDISNSLSIINRKYL